MKKTGTNRIFELDFLRGLAVFLMCLDHLVFDFYCLPYWFPLSDSPIIDGLGVFGDKVFFSDWRLALHYVFATLFLLLAGVGSSLTRHHGKRILQIGGAALLLTVATVLIDLFLDLGATIVFGVLSAMTVGVVLCWLCSLFGERAGKYIALALGIGIVAVGFSLPWYAAPEIRYPAWDDLWRIAVGTLHFGGDWFPVFPSSGVILIGYFLGKVLYRQRRSLIPALRGKTDYFFCPIGRKPLWIYLLHQPVIMGLLYLFVFLISGD